MRTLATATLVTALLFVLSGCDSVVERTDPSTSVAQETALSSPDAIQGVRASMFDRMHGTLDDPDNIDDVSNGLNTDWLLGPSALADNTFFRGNQERHQGLNRNLLRSGIGTEAYNNIYNVVNDANVLINGIRQGAIPPEQETKLKAEARFMRALVLHHAVRIFGYDPDGQGGVVSPNSGPGAGFNLGVVVRTEPTLSVEDATSKPRSTVPEVYQQINADLDQALSAFQGLPSEAKENSPFFPSEAAVQALRARVKLYQRDWSAANSAAQSAINLAASSFGSGLAQDSSELASIFDETSGGNPEAIFTISTDPATESIGVNESISAYTSLFWLAQLPTQDLISEYEAADARLEAWYEPCFDEINDEDPGGCGEVNSQGLELHKYASERSFSRYADDYVHLRIAEMYLIQAEARLNTGGVGPAISRLNDLRTTRGASQLNPANFTEASAYDEILDERRRELVAEGHRFFDLKRLGRDIAKAAGRSDVPFNNFRVLDDLPPAQLGVNDELEQNPGYQ